MLLAAYIVCFVAGCVFVGVRLERLSKNIGRVDDTLFSQRLELEAMRNQHYQAAQQMKRVAENFEWPHGSVFPPELEEMTPAEVAPAKRRRKK